jgi:two-component system cell cycle sensor histidine kinase PleC
MSVALIFIVSTILLVALTLYLGKLLYEYKIHRQKALVSSKAKSLFIQKIAYELRNPLNGIIGFSEMLEAGYFGELSPKQQERVHDIYLCGVQLQSLVKDFISLSKGESGVIELIETSATLSLIIEKTIEELKNKIDSNKLRILTDLHDANLIFKCDQNKLIQAFKNIIDNAIKFSPKSSQLTIKQHQIQGKNLRISFADSGIGMTQDELDTIFLFPDDTRKAKSLNGLGMGLPLAKLFIELHEGTIEVDSEEKLGTTVTVILPESRLK